jgi:putative ubiquitin-RnfH superfamily antitoxin RatB of RatAB toxin-antitoxin module
MAKLSIEVAAALPERQAVIPLSVDEGCTVWEAVQRSGIADRLPELAIDEKRIGVFGRICKPDRRLRQGDRVEIYRPLTADPKEIRRQLAELERAGKKAN